MFSYLNPFSIFQSDDKKSALISDDHTNKNYGSTLVKKNIEMHSEHNAEIFFQARDILLRKKLFVIKKLKDHLELNPYPTPNKSISYYLENMELASCSIAKINLSKADKDSFRKEVFFNPASIAGKNENFKMDADFYAAYNQLIGKISHPDYYDELSHNKRLLEKLTMSYKENIDRLCDCYLNGLQKNKEAMDVVRNAAAAGTRCAL